MNFSELTFSLLFMFLPGVISMLLINLLTNSRVYDSKIFFLYSYLISVLSYSMLSIFSTSSFMTYLVKGELKIQIKEIFFATGISVVFAILIVFITNSKKVFILAGKLKITNKYGNGDVWSTIFNDPQITWITLRPQNCSYYYVGEIEHFSDDVNIREIVLKDVAYYEEESGKYLYSQDRIYVSFPIDSDITIEIGNHYIDSRRGGDTSNGEETDDAEI